MGNQVNRLHDADTFGLWVVFGDSGLVEARRRPFSGQDLWTGMGDRAAFWLDVLSGR